MKTNSLFLFLSCTILSIKAFGTIHTVNNNLNGPGQFSALQPAIDAATAGDTIYVASSPSTYTDATDAIFQVTKKLTFIGVGMRPGEKKENSALSRIGSRFDITGSEASGSAWIGFYFQGVGSALNVGAGVNNCQVLRNWFDGSSTYMAFNSSAFSGWLIANNFFGINCGPGINLNSNTVTNFIIQNNVFGESTGCGNLNIAVPLVNFSNSANCIVSNNVFYGQQNSGNSDQAFGNCSNMIVENNIFHTMSPAGLTNSVINNNITFGTAQDALPYGTNSGANNVANTDPQLTTFSVNSFDPRVQNFQPAGGPAKTGGVGGTQMGVYGGTGFNWNLSAVPALPVIKNFSITSGSTVPSGGNITIKVTSTKQN